MNAHADLLQARSREVRDDDRSALGGEQPRRRGADRPGAAGDQRDFAVKFSHGASIMIRQMKVAIAGGAGGVGSSLAFNLLVRPEPYDVIVVDRRPEKVLSHVMDLEQVLTLGSGRSVRPGSLEDLAHADVVVICAATPLTENTTRDVYLADNARIVARDRRAHR